MTKEPWEEVSTLSGSDGVIEEFFRATRRPGSPSDSGLLSLPKDLLFWFWLLVAGAQAFAERNVRSDKTEPAAVPGPRQTPQSRLLGWW